MKNEGVAVLRAVEISWPIVVAAVAGGISALVANLISFSMIDRLNARLPAAQQISYVWWGGNVRKMFKRMYPESKLVAVQDGCLVVMLFCFALGVRFWVFG